METDAVLQFSGFPRPFSQGDLTGLLTSLLEACRSVANTAGYPLSVTALETETSLYAAFEPRLIQMAAVGLIRAACLSNHHSPVSASLSGSLHAVTLTVTGDSPPADRQAIELAREVARLHQGGLAESGGTIGFSIRTTLPAPAAISPPPAQQSCWIICFPVFRWVYMLFYTTRFKTNPFAMR